MKVFITGEVPGDGDSFGLDSTLCLVDLERMERMERRGEKEECCYKRDEPETGGRNQGKQGSETEFGRHSGGLALRCLSRCEAGGV